MAMNQHIQQPAQRGDRVAARTGAASLARRQVLLQRRHQEAVATAWAVWSDGQLCCDRLLDARARLLVDLGVELSSDDPPRRYNASLQAPPVAVLLTLIRGCARITVMEVDLGDGFA